MFGRISSRYDVTNDILSFGIHRRWKKLLKRRAKLDPDKVALDICTGTGEVALTLNDRFPGRVYAVDFVREMVQCAIAKNSDIKYLVGDALSLPFVGGQFGLVTISFGIRNLDNTKEGLQEIFRVLAPKSQVLILEFGESKVTLFGKLYQLYAKYLIPSIGGLVTGDRSAYEYLPRTAAVFPARESFTELMKEVGFKSCSYTALSFGIAYLYEGVKE